MKAKSALFTVIFSFIFISAGPQYCCGQESGRRKVPDLLTLLHPALQKAAAAEKKEQYTEMLRYYFEAEKVAKDYPPVMYLKAKAFARQGHFGSAVRTLGKLISTGALVNIYDEDTFLPIINNGAFKKLVRFSKRNAEPLSIAETVFVLNDTMLFPEGIAYDPVTERFFLGSMVSRNIRSVDRTGAMTQFSASEQDGMFVPLGMKVIPVKREQIVISTALNGPVKPVMLRVPLKYRMSVKSGTGSVHLNNFFTIILFFLNLPDIHSIKKGMPEICNGRMRPVCMYQK